MECNNIDIKKLQKFCRILVKYGINKNIYGTTTIKKIMTVREYQNLYQEWKKKNLNYTMSTHKYTTTTEKQWNEKTQKFEKPNDLVFLKDIAKHGMTEEDFYNQKVEISYKISNEKKCSKLINLLSKYLNIDYDEIRNNLDNAESTLKSIINYFSKTKNSQDFSFFSFEVCEDVYNCKLIKLLKLKFANSNFRLQLEI